MKNEKRVKELLLKKLNLMRKFLKFHLIELNKIPSTGFSTKNKEKSIFLESFFFVFFWLSNLKHFCSLFFVLSLILKCWSQNKRISTLYVFNMCVYDYKYFFSYHAFLSNELSKKISFTQQHIFGQGEGSRR